MHVSVRHQRHAHGPLAAVQVLVPQAVEAAGGRGPHGGLPVRGTAVFPAVPEAAQLAAGHGHPGGVHGPRHAVLVTVAQRFQLSVGRGLGARVLVPRAPVQMAVPQAVHAAVPGGRRDGALVPRHPEAAGRGQAVQVTVDRGHGAHGRGETVGGSDPLAGRRHADQPHAARLQVDRSLDVVRVFAVCPLYVLRRAQGVRQFGQTEQLRAEREKTSAKNML